MQLYNCYNLNHWLATCKYKESENREDKKNETVTTYLNVDHVNIWTKNPTEAKKRLTEIGFTSLPDSLSPIHRGQGTAGRYFFLK